ncbi:hypothetical protein PAMP_006917 [Pampus punctatissimus]
MTSRRTGYTGGMDTGGSSVHSGNRKQSIINIPERAGPESCYDRKADKAGYGASHGGVTVTSLKSRLAPTIQNAMSAAVDTLLGEVVLVLNETQQELLHKEQENERLKVRLEVSERELKTLQECLCSAQKLIDQLQISYTGPQTISQSVFAPSLSSMASMTAGLDRDHQSPRNVNGAGVDLGLGGSVDESLHGFEPRDDYKMCQLSIQPDGSVTNHTLDSFASNTSHMCSDTSRPDERQSQGPGGTSRFEIKEEQGPASGSGQSSRKEPGMRNDNRDGERSSHSVGDLGYVQVGGDGGSQRSFTHPLRHQRPVRECTSALQQGGLDGQKPLARTSGAGRGDCVSPGQAEDSAGPFKEPAALRKHIRTHREEGGHMGIGASDDTDPDALDDINNLHPAAPSPQMRFGEWGAEEDDSSVVDCV